MCDKSIIENGGAIMEDLLLTAINIYKDVPKLFIIIDIN